jgi:HD superfamily phosphodiesterase
MLGSDSAFTIALDNLADSLPRRWAHVQGVQNRAQIATQVFDHGDAEDLKAAAVLHDIGYSPKIQKTGFHPLDGAQYLKSMGISLRICALVAHHSCAFREAEEPFQRLGAAGGLRPSSTPRRPEYGMIMN